MDKLLTHYAQMESVNGFKENGDTLTVLVVEDSPVQHAELRYALWTVGYVIKDAYSLQEALDYYKEVNPDVVTLDLELPDTKGSESFQKMLEFYPQAKIVVISTQAKKDVVLSAIQQGVSNFIVKPLDEANLKQALEVIKKAAVS